MLPTNRSPRKALLLGVAVLLASLIVITTTYRIASSHSVPFSSTSSPPSHSASKELPPATHPFWPSPLRSATIHRCRPEQRRRSPVRQRRNETEQPHYLRQPLRLRQIL